MVFTSFTSIREELINKEVFDIFKTVEFKYVFKGRARVMMVKKISIIVPWVTEREANLSI